MGIEYFLKAKLTLISPESNYMASHDTINILRELEEHYKPSKDIRQTVRLSSKYHNESRYPAGGEEAYTLDFAKEFLSNVLEVKEYIDVECAATVDDLVNQFRKSH
jgi:HEPN domain-containing protein